MFNKVFINTCVGAVALFSAFSFAASLSDPDKKDIAFQIVSAAENADLDWRAQYSYIEDIDDGRGYTAGIIGFCSGCGDMLSVVEKYTQLRKNNVLKKYIPRLRELADSESDSTSGLGSNFMRDWRTAANDAKFRQAQDFIRDRDYFNPALNLARQDGLSVLGQFMYYDSIVMHGEESGMAPGLLEQREQAMEQVPTPAEGGDETEYLEAFMDARISAMQQEEAHSDVSRVTGAQAVFLEEENWDLDPPLYFTIYRDHYEITE